MTVEDLVESHVRQYNAKMQHIDELVARAEKAAQTQPATWLDQEISEIRREREKLLAHMDALETQMRNDWQESDVSEQGPMMVWEAVAKRLEKLVERIEQ